MADGVLEDEPRGPCPVLANEIASRPAVGVDDRGQPGGVLVLGGLHGRVVAAEQRAVRGEFGPHPLVLRGHRYQLISQGGIHRASAPGPVAVPPRPAASSE